MGLLVDDLLLLARLDQQRPLERGLVDLLVLAADAVHDARAVAPGRPIRQEARTGTEAHTGTAVVVTGDESRLRQVLGNLLGNALAHTPEGTPVTVRVATRPAETGEPPWAVLEVADEGPGLTPADAAPVFERFYRADRSRSRRRAAAVWDCLSWPRSPPRTAAAWSSTPRSDAMRRFRVLLPLAPHEWGAEVTGGSPSQPADSRAPAGGPPGADGALERTGT